MRKKKEIIVRKLVPSDFLPPSLEKVDFRADWERYIKDAKKYFKTKTLPRDLEAELLLEFGKNLERIRKKTPSSVVLQEEVLQYRDFVESEYVAETNRPSTKFYREEYAKSYMFVSGLVKRTERSYVRRLSYYRRKKQIKRYGDIYAAAAMNFHCDIYPEKHDPTGTHPELHEITDHWYVATVKGPTISENEVLVQHDMVFVGHVRLSWRLGQVRNIYRAKKR